MTDRQVSSNFRHVESAAPRSQLSELNASLPWFSRCAIPQCASTPTVGPLCWHHAVAVAEAVNDTNANRINHVQADAAIRRHEQAKRDAERLASKRTAPGWVYYVRVGDRVKIGYSGDVKKRMKAYPPDSVLLAVHPGTRQLETEMHQRFAGSRAAGREWFRETPDLTEHIDQVLAQFGEPTRHRHNFRRDTAPMRLSRSA